MAFTNVGERWRIISLGGLPYAVSDQGNVASLSCGGGLGRPRKFHNDRGYMNVDCGGAGNSKSYKVHRLVMLAFVGQSELHVNHKDLDKSNNHLWNLEYVTQSENLKHAVRMRGPWGSLTPDHRPLGVVGMGRRGSLHPGSKLNESSVAEIRALAASGVSVRVIASKYGVRLTAIRNVVSRKRWRHVA